MKLIDFLRFEPFNALRQKVGTRKLGYFELFDPDRHLTGEERIELERDGVQVPAQRVKRLVDGTLAYKNSRVVCTPVMMSQSELIASPPRYHLTNCETLSRYVSKTSEPLSLRVTSSSKTTQPLRVEGQKSLEFRDFQVCEECLQQLGFEGFDQQRNRRRAYSLNLLESFSIDKFFALYTLYPVRLEEQAEQQEGGQYWWAIEASKE